jgi:hypothetical protein
VFHLFEVCLFGGIADFNQLNSAREGCGFFSEICKLGLYGITPSKMERYASALLADAEQFWLPMGG